VVVRIAILKHDFCCNSCVTTIAFASLTLKRQRIYTLRDQNVNPGVVSWQNALVIGLAIGILTTIVCYLVRLRIQPGPGDFFWPLRSARDLLMMQNPYDHPVTVESIPYPLPAAFIGLPFIWLPAPLAAAAFYGISSALLAFGLVRTGPAWRLLVFTTPLYIDALIFAQWPPLIMAMAFFPGLLFLGLVKPHIAAPLALSGYVRWTKRGVILALLVGIISLALVPDWPLRWISQLQPYEGLRPPLFWWGVGGPLILLALLRWRQKGARLLLLMSLVPQRMFYDQLALWFIPRTIAEFSFLTLASWLGVIAWIFYQVPPLVGVMLSVYLPTLLLVLLPDHFALKITDFLRAKRESLG
jgi:hypothetical protein